MVEMLNTYQYDSETRAIYPFDRLQKLSFWVSMVVLQLNSESAALTLQARRRQVLEICKRLKPLANAHAIKSKGLWFGIYYSLFDERHPEIQRVLARHRQERPKYIELFTGTRAERAVKCVAMLTRKYDSLVAQGLVNPNALL
jgi:hypothetical protein